MRRALNKLRRTSVDELRVRGSQALAALSERHGLSSQTTLPTDSAFSKLLDPRLDLDASDFLEHFRNRTQPAFFTSFKDPQATIVELRKRWPHCEDQILARADRICSNRFDLLGWRDLFFGDPIDWHLEPVAGKRAPVVHWSRLNYLDSDVAGDKKIIWELNRHQHFITLGQAYWLSGDERFARVFVGQLDSWMEQNPPKLGINWASSLEVAFRSIAWLWALHFFRKSESLTPQIFLKASKFLYLNARHLETYLSTYFSPNTHLTGEALGLFYLGSLFPEFADAGRWKSTGLRILLSQLPRHVQPDGVYFEQSSYYHRYTTDFLIHLTLLLKANGDAVPNEVEHNLRLLLDHLMFITRPDGTSPLFGDDDGGRLVKLDDRRANDFRATLSTGAVMLKRADYKFVAGEAADETLWLLGPKGLSELDGIIAKESVVQSVAFDSGGYYVMRDGWTATSNYLLFDCGPHGTANCGHAHADALSFELSAHGRTTLVDPGTYTYTGSSQMRDWFRSSAAHNTLTIDDKSSSVSAGPFSWKTISSGLSTTWINQARFDYVTGTHDGYSRLSNAATHWRSIFFVKGSYWVIRDVVETSGEHELKLWFHFADGVGPLHARNNAVEVISDNGDTTRLQISTFARGGSWSKEKGWVSTCYGEKSEAPVFAYSMVAKGSEELVTFLLPRASGAVPAAVIREIEANDGRAFEINTGEHHDILMVRGFLEPAIDLELGMFYESRYGRADVTHRVEIARISSDFDVSWFRFANERARMPEEVLLIAGSRMELDGRELVRTKERVGHLVLGKEDLE